ncbi:hypothetical protein [Novosphingobium clariflavum]|uniref:Uncharacterized protein n=1 Tax=Novosphingobium clariflavum TaxID=2029884 RepID=A0ABV6SB27_9SPHN|nr:hypothetical protein [Novosphingobium clariflavum]
MNISEPAPSLIDAQANFRVEGSQVVRKLTQALPDSFLKNLREKRDASMSAPMGNFHHVASIPEALVEKWRLEGFDIFDKNITIPEILKRLHREDMEGLIATNRKI